MLYALLCKDKLIGLFSDIKKCKLTIQGLVSNKFIKETDLTFVSYHENSITKTTPPNIFLEQSSDDNIFEEITSENTTESNDDTGTESSEDNTEKREKRARDQKRVKKMEYNLNLLKQKKERLEESKNVFKVDHELYKKFKKIKSETQDFEIPDMFIDKYELMEELESMNKLTWKNFHDCYEKKPLENSYNMLFTGNAKERELLSISNSEEDKLPNNSKEQSGEMNTL